MILMLRLFTTVYPERNAGRKQEYEECLRRNLACAEVNEVRLLVEGEGFHLAPSPKLHLRTIPERPLYEDYFRWINELARPDDVSIIVNTDIWFDGSVGAVDRALRKGECFALARWDGDMLCDRNDTQDCWVFRGKVNGVRGDFPPGVGRCDNRILYELQAAGYRVRNPAFSVKAHHLHSGERVNYATENLPHFVPPPYRYLWPHNLWSLTATFWHNLRHPACRIGWRLDRRRLSRTFPARAWTKLFGGGRRAG